jgi:hypothetical protein
MNDGFWVEIILIKVINKGYDQILIHPHKLVHI